MLTINDSSSCDHGPAPVCGGVPLVLYPKRAIPRVESPFAEDNPDRTEMLRAKITPSTRNWRPGGRMSFLYFYKLIKIHNIEWHTPERARVALELNGIFKKVQQGSPRRSTGLRGRKPESGCNSIICGGGKWTGKHALIGHLLGCFFRQICGSCGGHCLENAD